MKVLLAGVNSYIGKRLVPFLAEKGHEVVCIVRDKKTASAQNIHGDIRASATTVQESYLWDSRSAQAY